MLLPHIHLLVEGNNLNEEIFWIWTTLFNYNEEEALLDFLKRVDDFNEIWSLSAKSFYKAMNCTYEIAEYFADISKKDRAKEIFEQCVEKGIKRVFYKDDEYPELLKHISGPPRILYVKGNGILDREAIR